MDEERKIDAQAETLIRDDGMIQTFVRTVLQPRCNTRLIHLDTFLNEILAGGGSLLNEAREGVVYGRRIFVAEDQENGVVFGVHGTVVVLEGQTFLQGVQYAKMHSEIRPYVDEKDSKE